MKSILCRVLTVCTFVLSFAMSTFATPGELDATFGTGGKVFTDVEGED